MDEETNGPRKKRKSSTTKGRRMEPKDPRTERTNPYFEPEIHHAPFKDKSRRPLSSEAFGDFEIDGE
jgi:hypothetical protein